MEVISINSAENTAEQLSTVTTSSTPAATQPPSVEYSEGMRTRLTQLAKEAANWQDTAYTTANAGLYLLLQQCYGLYKELTDTTDANLKYKKQGLADHMSLKKLDAYKDKPLPQKIIRCVFGERDRRRISTYNVVLRCMIAEGWAVGDVPAKITERGGVQEMSLSRKPGSLTSKQKAAEVGTKVSEQTLATVKNVATDKLFEPEKVGEKFAAVLTLEADGSFSINCIVLSNGAVTTALTAFYAAEQAAAKAAVKAAVKAAETKAAQNAAT
jgi:hypothetical protein